MAERRQARLSFVVAPRLALLAMMACISMYADAYQDRLEKAVSFYSQKHYSEAAALLQSLVESDPGKKDAYLWLGHSRSELQDWVAARDAYKKYVDLAPRDVEGPRGVARSFEAEKSKDLALLWYRKALELEPGNDRLRQSVNKLEGDGAPPTPGEPPPSSNTQAKAEVPPSSSRPGFWRQGVAGLIGVREVWWGRTLAVVVFGMWLLGSAQQSTRTMRAQMPNFPDGAFTIQFILSTTFFYIVVWGFPSGWSWALLGLCIVLTVSASKAVPR